MRSLSVKIVATLGASALLVMGVDAATYAATGNSLVLGHINTANQSTTVKNTGAGPALKIISRPAAPPLAVSSTKKVAKLNVDRVDNLNGAQLTTKPTVYGDNNGATDRGGIEFWTIPLGKGSYQVSWSAALNPTTGSAASPTTTVCGILQGAPNGPYFGVDMAPYIGNFGQMFLSGDTVVTMPAAGNVDFFCQVTQGTFSLDNGVQVEVVKTNGRTSLNLGVTPFSASKQAPLGR